MTATLPNLDQLKPNPHWARRPLFERKGWTTVRWGEAANVCEVTRERAQSFLTDDHIERIVQAYERFKDEPGFTRVVTLEEIHAKDGNLSIPLYVAPQVIADPSSGGESEASLEAVIGTWLESSQELKVIMNELLMKNRDTGKN